MFKILAKIFKWVNPLDKVIEELTEVYKKKLEAKSYKERIEAEVLIKSLELKRDVLIEELRYSSTRWIRPALVLPFFIYDFSVLVFGYVLGWWVIPMLPEPWWNLHYIVYGFYFLGRPFEKIFGRGK